MQLPRRQVTERRLKPVRVRIGDAHQRRPLALDEERQTIGARGLPLSTHASH